MDAQTALVQRAVKGLVPVLIPVVEVQAREPPARQAIF